MKIPQFMHLFFAFIISVLSVNNAQAQTITLGDDVTEITGITTSSPINIWFRKTVCQMVYTEAELTASGAVAGSITQLGFFITNNPIFGLPEYEIQIKHTTDSDASGDLEGGYTTVKTIDLYEPEAGGWDMLELDTPFEWDGVQNIVVRVCWSRVSPTFDPSGQLRVYPATNGYKYRRSDAAGTACGLVPNITLNTKPQMRFVFSNETVWTGLISNDWNNLLNWTSGVPSQDIDAVINTGTPNDPLLNATGSCNRLTLNGSMTLGINGQLNIHEDFVNAGTYTDLGGVTRFTGSSAHNLSTTSEMTIENLQSNSSAGLDLSGNVVIGRELQVNKGLLNTGDLLTLRSDADGTARIDELSTTCTYTLNMTDTWGDGWNGGFITVLEDGIEIGSFFGLDDASTETFEIVTGADFTINYTAGSFENENAYTLLDEDGGVLFSDGTTPSTGDVFTGTASGCSFSSTIFGNITMERYIDEGETYWRYFASAVEDPTISQYLDDFTTAGFEGTPFPDFPFTSIYSYDETQPAGAGYVPCASTGEVIEVGQGYQVWSGDTITGTDPFLVDLVGAANQGDLSLPVTYTPSGTPTEDGWCLVGNPYASTINWDAPTWTKTNMANATYIQNPDDQTYATYIAGASANGGSRFIASQQSFWVHAVGASPELTARESVKADVDAVFFRSGDTYSAGMNIRLQGSGASDEAVLRHIEGTTDAVDAEFDAEKLYGGWGVNPQIMLLNDEEKALTVHSFENMFEEKTIPLQVIVFETGTYTLEFLNTSEMEVPCLKLEDTYSGLFYDIDMEDGSVFSFELSDTMYAPRFVLHLGRNYEKIAVDAVCYGMNSGEVEVDLDREDELSYTISSGDWSLSDVGTANPLVIDELYSGIYTLVVDGLGDLCASDTFHFWIDEPTPITIDGTVENESFGGDGAIVVTAEGGVPPFSYEWDTGDTEFYVSDLFPGTYTVTVTDGNGCENEASYLIDTELSIIEEEGVAVKVTYNATNKVLSLTGEELPKEIAIYSITGGLIETYTLSETDATQEITLPTNLAKGIYVLKPFETNWAYRFSY